MWVPTQQKERQSAGRHGDKFWEEEKNSFGFRMMAKMGYKQGDGLGREKSGINSYLTAKKKNDSLGIGASIAQSDEQYTASQSIYNDLLSRLSVGNDTDGGIQPEEKSTTTTAAMLKQKMESRRLYSRFSKAKDTSNYSKEQMNQILGKRDSNSTGTGASSSNSKPELEEGDNVITITSTVSMNDYFANRMTSVAKSLQENQQQKGGFTENDQENYYNMMMGMSHTGRGGLGANDMESQASMLRKLNPATKKKDPKNWALANDPGLAAATHNGEAAPVQRQTLSLWVEPEKEVKKSKKDKKEKKDKKGEKLVKLANVCHKQVAKQIGATLTKTETGLSLTALEKKVKKKVEGANLDHITNAFFSNDFTYGVMIKHTSSKLSFNDCALCSATHSLCVKTDNWVTLDKAVKKVNKKTGNNHSAKDIMGALTSRAADEIIVHVYQK